MYVRVYARRFYVLCVCPTLATMIEDAEHGFLRIARAVLNSSPNPPPTLLCVYDVDVSA